MVLKTFPPNTFIHSRNFSVLILFQEIAQFSSTCDTFTIVWMSLIQQGMSYVVLLSGELGNENTAKYTSTSLVLGSTLLFMEVKKDERSDCTKQKVRKQISQHFKDPRKKGCHKQTRKCVKFNLDNNHTPYLRSSHPETAIGWRAYEKIFKNVFMIHTFLYLSKRIQCAQNEPFIIIAAYCYKAFILLAEV